MNLRRVGPLPRNAIVLERAFLTNSEPLVLSIVSELTFGTFGPDLYQSKVASGAYSIPAGHCGELAGRLLRLP